MARVVLLTGGNVGDVKERLRTAQRLVNARIGAVLRCSHCYGSAPWGFEAEQPFVNQVLVADTDLAPHEVLAEVHRIEPGAGAQPCRRGGRTGRYGAALRLAADRYRHPALRRRGDLHARADDPASGYRRARVRPHAAVRSTAPAASSRAGAYDGRTAR